MRIVRTLVAAALLAAVATVGATSASAAPVDLKTTTSPVLSWGWGN